MWNAPRINVQSELVVWMINIRELTLNTNLPWLGSGNPSNVQDICGVGLPAALHFSDTAGPGCKVCSMKLYNKAGGASEKKIH